MANRMLWLLAGLLFLTGCQPGLKAPVADIRALEPVNLQQGLFTVQLKLHNPTKRAYRIRNLQLRLELDPQLHLQGATDQTLEMGARATEVITIPLRRTQMSKIYWAGFFDRPGEAMPYEATLDIRLDGERSWQQELKGHLYKVPGRRWHLRG